MCGQPAEFTSSVLSLAFSHGRTDEAPGGVLTLRKGSCAVLVTDSVFVPPCADAFDLSR